MLIGGVSEFDPNGLDPLDAVQARRAAIVLLILTAPIALAVARASWRTRQSANLQTES